MDFKELMWNFAKQEDVLINDMSVAQDRVSGKMKVLPDNIAGYKRTSARDQKDKCATHQGGQGQGHPL